MPQHLDSAARAALSTMCRQCARSATKHTFPRLTPSMPRTIHSGMTARPARKATSITTTQDLKRSSSAFAQAASLFGPKTSSANDQQPSGGRVLREDELFNSYTNSPIPRIRQRAAFMRHHAYCPCPEHQPTRLSESGQPLRQSAETSRLPPAHVDFECPDCGVPVYCSKEHWMSDYEAHLEFCDTLRQINEDDHDLHSGRFFPEFEYAGPQLEEAMVNMTNWDTFLYTRTFKAVDSDRSMRQATRMLTYPVTVGSILHELSPYSLREDSRLTPEGLKSLSGEFCKIHPFFFLRSCDQLTQVISSSVYSPSSQDRWWYRCQRPSAGGPARATIHSWCTRRIFAPTRCLDTTCSPIPPLKLPPHIYWTRGYVESR